MTIREFVKKINELGFYVCRDGRYTIVYKPFEHIAEIDETMRYGLNYISCENEELFKLCAEYAYTSLEEREDEKKYYLRKINKKFYEGGYLNKSKDYNHWLLGDNIEDAHYKTKFTWNEIEDIKKKFSTDLCAFVKEVVE